MAIKKIVLIDFNKVEFKTSEAPYIRKEDLKIINSDKNILITDISCKDKSYTITLASEINIKCLSFLVYKNVSYKILYSKLYEAESFNKKYAYSGSLGCEYSKHSSTFKLWTPAALSVKLLLYKKCSLESLKPDFIYDMHETSGVFNIKIGGDLSGLFYRYEVNVYGNINLAVDPYAKAVGINGILGFITDIEKTSPEDFKNDTLSWNKSFTDAVIYELSVRDFTMDKNCFSKYPGKFLGLTEKNLKTSEGLSAGLDHLIELGITHVQLMPVFDFSYTSTDERNPVKYNWGYDPQNLNAIEGSYSTDPYDPINRIYEFKELIMAFHNSKIFVNMDVVFNHIFSEKDNNFEKIFPGYYFRIDETGKYTKSSGCQNDTASEHIMMKKFIIDTVLYFVKEYHIDGFRFDLMGLHDTDTMNELRKELNNLKKGIMLYGEGWDFKSNLPENKKASIKNSSSMPTIGHFNDAFRDTIRGSVFIKNDKGFVNGKEGLENKLKNVCAGSIKYSKEMSGLFNSPSESINYFSCHDNNLLWDKLYLSNSSDSEDNRKKMHKLCFAIMFLSQGIPFISEGDEFLRTKKLDSNSFTAPDSENQIYWNLKHKNHDVFQYVKSLIDFRKNHPAFRMKSAEDIIKNLKFIESPKGSIAFELTNHANGDTFKDILVIFNANKNKISLKPASYEWKNVKELNPSKIESSQIEIDPISCSVFYR